MLHPQPSILTSVRRLLSSTEPPYLHLLDISKSEAYDYARALAQLSVATRVVRGSRMTSLSALFDEFSAALQFPGYFGENWPAFAECVRDLSWLPADGYGIMVVDSHLLLEDSDADFAILLKTLLRASAHWARPIVEGEPWDRAAKPFHVVFQCERKTECALVVKRFESVEIDLVPVSMLSEAGPTS